MFHCGDVVDVDLFLQYHNKPFPIQLYSKHTRRKRQLTNHLMSLIFPPSVTQSPTPLIENIPLYLLFVISVVTWLVHHRSPPTQPNSFETTFHKLQSLHPLSKSAFFEELWQGRGGR